MITLHTSFGDITIELDFNNTPNTAKNFLRYANEGFYEGTIFHRVINNFMIQGGGFDKNMQQKQTHAPIENEAEKGQPNNRGTIAMARTMDPHSATAQFFINVVDNPFLNYKSKTPDGWGYCVFGRVISGMEVVDKIRDVSTTAKAGHHDVPLFPVIIERITIDEEKLTSQ